MEGALDPRMARRCATSSYRLSVIIALRLGMYFILLPISASVCHVVGLHVPLLICSWFNIRDKRL